MGASFVSTRMVGGAPATSSRSAPRASTSAASQSSTRDVSTPPGDGSRLQRVELLGQQVEIVGFGHGFAFQ